MRIKYKDNTDKYVCKKRACDGNNEIFVGEHCTLKKIKNKYQLKSEKTNVKVSGTRKQVGEYFEQPKTDFEYDSKFYDGWDCIFLAFNICSLFLLLTMFLSLATDCFDFNFSWTGFIIITLSTIILLEILHFFNIKRIKKKFIITKIGLSDIFKSKLFHFLPTLFIIGIFKVLYDVMKFLYEVMKVVFNELKELFVFITKLIVYIFKLFGEYFIYLIIILAVIIAVIIIIYLFMQINLYYTKKYIKRGKK